MKTVIILRLWIHTELYPSPKDTIGSLCCQCLWWWNLMSATIVNCVHDSSYLWGQKAIRNSYSQTTHLSITYRSQNHNMTQHSSDNRFSFCLHRGFQVYRRINTPKLLIVLREKINTPKNMLMLILVFPEHWQNTLWGGGTKFLLFLTSLLNLPAYGTNLLIVLNIATSGSFPPTGSLLVSVPNRLSWAQLSSLLLLLHY